MRSMFSVTELRRPVELTFVGKEKYIFREWTRNFRELIRNIYIKWPALILFVLSFIKFSRMVKLTWTEEIMTYFQIVLWPSHVRPHRGKSTCKILSQKEETVYADSRPRRWLELIFSYLRVYQNHRANLIQNWHKADTKHPYRSGRLLSRGDN